MSMDDVEIVVHVLDCLILTKSGGQRRNITGYTILTNNRRKYARF